MMTHFREPVNGLTHLVGAILASLGFVWLLTVTRGDAPKMIAVAIYGISQILIFAASATFHLTKGSDQTLLWLRRLDHAAIYIVIAGTYTPFCCLVLTGNTRWLLLGLVWTMALSGAAYKLLFLNGQSLWSLFSYLAMGWLGILALPEGLALLPQGAVMLLISGGIVYTIGAIIFGLQKPNFHPQFGHHELWHLFVMGGSALHFFAIIRYVV
jgi:hemolysin III